MNPEGRVILPGIAFKSFNQRFEEPALPEGFQDIYKVGFEVRTFQTMRLGPQNATIVKAEMTASTNRRAFTVQRKRRPEETMVKVLGM
jgi:hypothetical protein